MSSEPKVSVDWTDLNFSDDDVDIWGALESMMEFPRPFPAIRHVQCAASHIYAQMPDKFRWWYSSSFKSQHKRHGDDQALKAIPSASIHRLASAIRQNQMPSVQPSIVLSHDVDYLACWNAIPKIAEAEAKRGIGSTWFFLVHAGYRIDVQLLNALTEMGHEVALHGWNYDLRLAWRSFATIKATLGRAKATLEDMLGAPVKGYRNHGLRISSQLIKALDACGFAYDSGLYQHRYSDQFSFASFYCWPFRYQDSKLAEIPVQWPLDTEMFRVFGMSDATGQQVFDARLDAVLSLGGVACFDTHPSVLIEHWPFYENFINGCAQRETPKKTCWQVAQTSSWPLKSPTLG